MYNMKDERHKSCILGNGGRPGTFWLGGTARQLHNGIASIVRHNGIRLQEGIQCGLQAVLPGHICGHSGLCGLCRCLGLRSHGGNIR